MRRTSVSGSTRGVDEICRCGWFQRVSRGRDFDEVAGAGLPGVLADLQVHTVLVDPTVLRDLEIDLMSHDLWVWPVATAPICVDGVRQAFQLRRRMVQAHRGDWDRLEQLLRRAKRMGCSDLQIAAVRGRTEQEIRALRYDLGVRPVYKTVDTCAAEFAAETPYHYSSYDEETEVAASDRKKVLILGSGPNRIGQGIEFDYACVHASFALHDAGFETVMVNCNPETVSTDYDTSDRLYFEPLTVEDVLEVVAAEQASGEVVGIIVQLGGQTPLRLAQELKDCGVPIVGTTPEAIHLAEERGAFGQVLREAGLPAPKHGLATSYAEAKAIADSVGRVLDRGVATPAIIRLRAVPARSRLACSRGLPQQFVFVAHVPRVQRVVAHGDRPIEASAAQHDGLQPVRRRVQRRGQRPGTAAFRAFLLRPQACVTLQLRGIFGVAAGGVVLDARGHAGDAAPARVQPLVHVGRLVTQLRAEQAFDRLAPPAAVIERRPEEMRAPQQAPDVGLFDATAVEQRTHRGQRIRIQPFVGVEQQYPRQARARDRRVLLRGEPEPGLLLHARAGGGGDGDGVVGGLRVEHHDLAADGRQARHAAADAIPFVLGDDHAGHGQRRGHQCRSRSRYGLSTTLPGGCSV